jgi:hypothetical protein
VTVVFLLIVLLAYLTYSGLFKQIEISTREPTHGDLTICYKTGRGPYKNTGDISSTQFMR